MLPISRHTSFRCSSSNASPTCSTKKSPVLSTSQAATSGTPCFRKTTASGFPTTAIEEIWVLIVPRKSHRLCAAQIFFNGGERRDYLIHYQSAAYGCAGSWSATSLKHGLPAGKLD